ncbi:MAG: UDP-3-O-[3-hydroxymyristoyl] N-acetylglucosamine deacetylase [Pirellulaceae bacterium]|nr:UDP-3-O-[3-hydroxymyristoyl] N-acetylglucosamine deacetylase [Pirellulaceae bacterium]
MRKQRTISRPAEVTGFGYWSGKDVRVEFRPAPPQSGIVFVRGDLDRPRRIPVAVEHRIEVPRRTALAADGAQVEMVEHILAALYGLSIDNCEIWVDGSEMPGCDGSALPFVTALDAVGYVEQPALRRRLVVTDVTRVGDDDCWIEARPFPGGRLSLKYKLDYGQNNPIGKQAIEVALNAASFRQELAPARTFILQEEADWLRQRGLGTRVTNQDLLVFGPDGVLDNELRFDNECVRHKALDLLGDLSLAGFDLAGQFIAYKSGHRLNAELVKVLLKEGQMEQELRRTG